MLTCVGNGRRAEKIGYAAFDVVVVAASAGGIEALLPMVRHLPSDFSAPIVVVHHLPPAARYKSRLAEILARNTPLEVKWVEDGEYLRPGRIYVAPQDKDPVFDLETGCLRLLAAEAKHAPAADPLFRSAAQVFGSRAMAVVLSGLLSDGAEGAAAIARAGGRVLAQTAAEAQFVDMPHAAMERSRVGLAFDSISLAIILRGLVMRPGVAAWFGVGKAGVGARLLAARSGRLRRVTPR